MVTRWSSVLMVSAAVTAYGCTRLTPEMQVARDAAEAMGGVDAVRSATTLVMEGTGTQYRLGQNTTPNADLPIYDVESYKKQVDLRNHRWRVELVRTGKFLTGNPVNQQRQIQAMDKDVAFNVGANGNATRQSSQVAKDRHAEFYHHPLVILQAALAEPPIATVSNLREERGHTIVDVSTADGTQLTVHFDPQTRLPVVAESISYDSNLGDVTIATTFSDYAEAGGLRLPGTISQKLDKFPNGDYRVTNTVNADVGDLAAPAEVVSAAEPAPPAADVTAEELADGVWLLAGQSHNSVLVEFPSYAALIEAPQNDTRTLAVIQKARELVAGKPLQFVINTHHHFDHSGGVRAAVGEGLTIITHEINRPFFEDMVARKHTVVADHLSKNSKPLSIQTVPGDGPYELKDGDRALEIHRIVGDAHNDGMLMVYLPRERILVEADAFASNSAAIPFAATLVKNIQDRKLRVDRIAALHGPLTSLAELEKKVKGMAPQTN